MAEQKRSGPSDEALAAFYRHQVEARRGSNTSAGKAKAPAPDPLAKPGVPQPDLPPITGLDFIDRILYGLQGKVK